MKYLFIVVLLAACCKENINSSQLGCQSGVNKQGVRVTLRCCTRAQFEMGDNVSKGGTKLFDSYSNQQWEVCSNCK